MTIQITTSHQALAAREAAEALRALAEEPERQGLVRGVALDACESLALRLDGAARTAVLAVRDRIWDNATTAEELRAMAEAWELAAGSYEMGAEVASGVWGGVRCSYRHRGGPQCIEREGHAPATPHLYRCAGPSCPGLTWPASERAHPGACGLDDELGVGDG